MGDTIKDLALIGAVAGGVLYLRGNIQVGDECSSDSDCPVGERCGNGTCQPTGV